MVMDQNASTGGSSANVSVYRVHQRSIRRDVTRDVTRDLTQDG
jgi:hypothetical protein